MQTATTKAPQAEVTILSPFVPPTRHQLAHDPVSIGRASECTIPIKDRYLSRKHAEIVMNDGLWVLKDCGSANGTFLNGSKVDRDCVLKTGDRIRLGDTELLFRSEHLSDRSISLGDSKVTPTISIPVIQLAQQPREVSGKTLERLRILNTLAEEFLEDQPLDELFGFIVERVLDHMKASRAAIGLLTEDGRSFGSVEVRRRDSTDTSELSLSRTLLAEVVEEKKSLAFLDIAGDEKLSRAKSIVMQGIHSALCAPMMIGESVVGVLYVDFLFSQKTISEDDVHLVAQIARFAAIKLENTRLREESIQKRLMDEELKTAYVIQRRLLPDEPPAVPGYTFAGSSKPCRAVSGDYYDWVVRPDGRVYFVIADVSGKGVTAALLMAGLQSSFRIFSKLDPSPAELVSRLNAALRENLPQSKFVTLFAGRLDTSTGAIEYANAGHTPPILIGRNRCEELTSTDMLLGMFPNSSYRNQSMVLEAGDALVLFTDGVTEAEAEEGVELGSERVCAAMKGSHGLTAGQIAERLERAVLDHVGDRHLTDDVTLVVVCRDNGEPTRSSGETTARQPAFSS
jgi:sigma-B regulation protein RsbU (phosphoserine phosphatase)